MNLSIPSRGFYFLKKSIAAQLYALFPFSPTLDRDSLDEVEEGYTAQVRIQIVDMYVCTR